MRKAIVTDKGVRPAAPYSQGIVAQGRTVYVSGQGSFDPATSQFQPGNFREQAERTFRNVGLILEAAGAGWQDVVKVNVYLANLLDFAELNEVYRQYLREPYPARTTVQAGLIGQMLIEVDCIAVISEAQSYAEAQRRRETHRKTTRSGGRCQGCISRCRFSPRRSLRLCASCVNLFASALWRAPGNVPASLTES